MGTMWTKAYVNQEIEQVRTELRESLEERQKKRRLSEVEHSAVKQATDAVPRFWGCQQIDFLVGTCRDYFFLRGTAWINRTWYIMVNL